MRAAAAAPVSGMLTVLVVPPAGLLLAGLLLARPLAAAARWPVAALALTPGRPVIS